VTILPGESFEDWSVRVQRYEYGRTLMKIAEGHDVESAMEEMSTRIVNKLNHYIITGLNTLPSTYNAEQAKQHYKENYLDRFGPKPDHIKD